MKERLHRTPPAGLRIACLLLLSLLVLGIGAPHCVAEHGEGSFEDRPTPRRLLTPADLSPPSAPNGWDWDTVAMDLELDLAGRRGSARLTLASPADSPTPPEIWLAVGDLTVERVEGPAGALAFAIVADAETGRRLEVATPLSGKGLVDLEIRYTFTIHHRFDGLLPGGVSSLWPYHCGNLFPCDPSPRDGFRFELSVRGLEAGQVLVAPEEVPGDGPPYMPALAVGDYTHHPLGTTAAGTEVGLWTPPATEGDALRGTADLVRVFDWYESTYGPYTFGGEVASVIVDWPSGGFGGLEHHPFWHVSTDSAGDAVTHAHEAAHGWFGNGVRIRCWEDFVLSEGLATYLAARALEAVRGAEAGEEIWDGYRARLAREVALRDTVAWPATCNEIDILRHPIWSRIPYLKGAFFLRRVEDEVGREALDRALAVFYRQHAGEATTMARLLATIRRETGFNPASLAHEWLRGRGIPH